MKCKACEEIAVGNSVCAFSSGVFVSDNWNCGTMHLLRRKVDPRCDDELRSAMYCGDDASMGAINLRDTGVLVLSWYKSRGRTGQAIVFRDDNVIPLTEEMALEFARDGELVRLRKIQPAGSP